MDKQFSFAEVILPLSIPGTFTYKIPEDEAVDLRVGLRVAVPFGGSKLYTGVLHSWHNNTPELFKPKGIYTFLESEPTVLPSQIAFWEWVANYYMCALGEVYRMALPAGLKPESETQIKVNPLLTEDLEEDRAVFDFVQENPGATLKDVAKVFGRKEAFKAIRELLANGHVQVMEVIQQRYKPKSKKFVALSQAYSDEQLNLEEVFKELQRAPKQRTFFLKLVSESAGKNETENWVLLQKLLKATETTHSVVTALEKKGLVQVQNRAVSRLQNKEVEELKNHDLTAVQSRAYTEIIEQFKPKNTVLLHGVMGSGKTMVYVQLIKRFMSLNEQVLLLVPEVGLSQRLLKRLEIYFGNKLGVYHSHLNSGEKVEFWQKVAGQDFKVVLGTRSALFLPFTNLGLIVIDEEQDSAYKEGFHSPRFHARETALYLAHRSQAKVLLGTATPSLETLVNASKKFGYVELNERYGQVALPQLHILDLADAKARNQIQEGFAEQTLNAIKQTLDEKKQVLVFQNRRGYAPVVECETCGHSPECTQCNVTLTLHKRERSLRCHYCGYQQSVPQKCHSCKSPKLNTKGTGTEQVSLFLERQFPTSVVQRMDKDTTRRKNAFMRLFEDFQLGEIDILVGTQMLVKGLNFSNVGLLVVPQADGLLNFPDFRAEERAFQLLTQFSGRSGLAQSVKLFVQTYRPNHPVFQHLKNDSFNDFAKYALIDRKAFIYPPYCRLIHIHFQHTSQERILKLSGVLAQRLKLFLNEQQVLGPQEPAVNRVRNKYRCYITLKILPNQSTEKLKNAVFKAYEDLLVVSAFRTVHVQWDVDPA